MFRKPAGIALGIVAVVLIGIFLKVSRASRKAEVLAQAPAPATTASSQGLAGTLDGGTVTTKSADRPGQEAATLSTDEPLGAAELSRDPRLADCQEGCTHCANLLKLSEYQAEYAEMQWTKILQTHRPEPSQVEDIRLACRQLADAVMLEWSLENNAPVLQAEATIRALEKEIIVPALAGVAAK